MGLLRVSIHKVRLVQALSSSLLSDCSCGLSCFECDHKLLRSKARAQAASIDARFTVPQCAPHLRTQINAGAARTDTELISAQGEHLVGYLPLTGCSLQLKMLRQSLLVDRRRRQPQD